ARPFGVPGERQAGWTDGVPPARPSRAAARRRWHGAHLAGEEPAARAARGTRCKASCEPALALPGRVGESLLEAHFDVVPAQNMVLRAAVRDLDRSHQRRAEPCS